jgi:hypothetical protein
VSEVAVYDRILCLKGAITLMDESPWIKGVMHGTTASGRRGCCAQGYIDFAAVAVFGNTMQACELFDATVNDVILVLPDLYKRMQFAQLSTWNDTLGREKAEVRQVFNRALEVLEVRMGVYNGVG